MDFSTRKITFVGIAGAHYFMSNSPPSESTGVWKNDELLCGNCRGDLRGRKGVLGSTTSVDDCILLKSTAGGGGVGISPPEMLKEANLGEKKRVEPRCLCVPPWAR